MIEVRCKYCNSRNTVKAGRRRLKTQIRQLYRCNECGRRFSNNIHSSKRTESGAILKALILHCQGYSYDDILFVLRKTYGINRTKGAISKWVNEFYPPYMEIRKLNHGCKTIVQSHLFTHNKLNYMYQVHIPKLRFAKNFGHLQTYLTKLPDFINPSLFETALHCSELKLRDNPGVQHSHLSAFNSPVADALTLAGSRRGRHQVVEDYLLSCDRNTIAVEVPIWFEDHAVGVIAGHIDLLQINYGKVYILDYKPNARKENPAKVVTQLNLYAIGLALRAGLKLKDIKCMYFDERDCFEFDPVYLNVGELLREKAV